MDFGTAIKELIIDNSLANIKIKTFAYPDKFIEHGDVKELEKIYKLDTNSIVEYVKKVCKEKEFKKSL